MTAKIDPRISQIIEAINTQIINVEIVFDTTSPVFEENFSLIKIYFEKFGSLIDKVFVPERGKKSVHCGIQAFLCGYLANECISIKEINLI